ncbi:MAG: 4-alpha-glucanotransferase [Acidobacteria bacterium]|nr:MAG: 4-alpha-glucanotransferase [Acidobacteriota bacterium]
MTHQRRDADPEALLLVLQAMGADVNSMDDVPDALRSRKDELRERAVEPVVVAWDGKLGRRRFEFGYHEIEIKRRPVFVISAPTRAYFPANHRLWGIFAPIYALHSKRNPYAGDVTDFENLMDWIYSLGGSVAASLPLLGAFLDEPFQASPYSPATRLFWNQFYIDLDRIPEFDGYRSGEPPKKTKYVDYRGVMAYKRHILEELSHKFFSAATRERQQAFGKFVRENKAVEDYAKFRAVVDRQRTGWHDWPARLRDGTIRKDDYDEATKNYHLYSQWIIQDQLQALSQRAAARGQFLYLDLPLGLHSDGYDVWRNRDLFVDRVAGGAPPDPVFTRGQNWGFPPMNPESMRLNRYQYVIAFLRNHFQYAKLLRIDHVMGLHRLYWIPDELTGDKGVYVEYPAEELWAILSLESHRYRAGIVGENLGTVPPEVNAAMADHDIRQMYVVQYELMGDPEKPTLRPPPEKCVASLNTHDMPPFRAFLDGTDIDDRLDLGFLDEKSARDERKRRAKMRAALQNDGHNSRNAIRMLQFLSDSMANIVLVNLEDLWDETRPQNVPATSTERPNWRRRVRPTLEQIRKMSGVAEVLSHVFAQRSRSLPV